MLEGLDNLGWPCSLVQLPSYCRSLYTEINDLRIERDKLKKAIEDCIDYANNRETEWGNRAIDAFDFLYRALEK